MHLRKLRNREIVMCEEQKGNLEIIESSTQKKSLDLHVTAWLPSLRTSTPNSHLPSTPHNLSNFNPTTNHETIRQCFFKIKEHSPHTYANSVRDAKHRHLQVSSYSIAIRIIFWRSNPRVEPPRLDASQKLRKISKPLLTMAVYWRPTSKPTSHTQGHVRSSHQVWSRLRAGCEFRTPAGDMQYMAGFLSERQPPLPCLHKNFPKIC